MTDVIQSFRALHAGADVLLLPNAWDAASAALFVRAGATAIATTSAGVAWSNGFEDGNALPRASLLFSAASIRRVARETPVTVDIEGGFSNDPREVANLVRELCALGVAGINIEDGTDPPELLAAKIEAVKRVVNDLGTDLFVNARTDVFLRDLASRAAAQDETIARARRYRLAGADGIFVPDLADEGTIRNVASAVELPLNLLAVPGLPTARTLYGLGVRRLSAGSAIAKVAYGTARRLAAAFLSDGDCGVLFGEPFVDYAETNALLAHARA